MISPFISALSLPIFFEEEMAAIGPDLVFARMFFRLTRETYLHEPDREVSYGSENTDTGRRTVLARLFENAGASLTKPPSSYPGLSVVVWPLHHDELEQVRIVVLGGEENGENELVQREVSVSGMSRLGYWL